MGDMPEWKKPKNRKNMTLADRANRVANARAKEKKIKANNGRAVKK